jgi:hypothetical protein
MNISLLAFWVNFYNLKFQIFQTRKLPSDRTRFHSIMPELFSAMTSAMVADLVCYPFETVLNRLFIQGIIIDNRFLKFKSK